MEGDKRGQGGEVKAPHPLGTFCVLSIVGLWSDLGADKTKITSLALKSPLWCQFRLY